MDSAPAEGLRASIAAAVAAALLVAAPGASAASSEAGWGCVADGSRAGWTLLASPHPTGSYSPLVKESPGVIVSWTVRVGPGLGPVVQQLGVFRRAAVSTFTKVAEQTVTVAEGTNEFPARIPVLGDDLIGISSPAETLVCEAQATASSPLFEGAMAVGETQAFGSASEVRPPVSAVVESDADGDGYGDFSQDGCPESAAYQSSCPIVALDVGEVEVRRRAILIEAAMNTAGSLEATGEVRWLVSPKRLPAKRSSQMPQVRVGLRTREPRAVQAETPVTLRVPLPRAVLNRLERLSPRRALRARIDVKGTNLVPYVGTQELKVRLPGRRPPAPRR